MVTGLTSKEEFHIRHNKKFPKIEKMCRVEQV